MTKKTSTDIPSLSELEHERNEIDKQIKIQRKIDAELELQMAVERMSDDSADSKKRILKACYKYIGTHRKD
jgi:hypothetical protein